MKHQHQHLSLFIFILFTFLIGVIHMAEDTKISGADPKASLAATDMIPIEAAGDATAYHITGETLFASITQGNTATKGILELATTAEAIAGTDTARAVTPQGLALGRVTLYQDPPAGTWARKISVSSLVDNTWLTVDLTVSGMPTTAKVFFGFISVFDYNLIDDIYTFYIRPYGVTDASNQQIHPTEHQYASATYTPRIAQFVIIPVVDGKIEIKFDGTENNNVDCNLYIYGWW